MSVSPATSLSRGCQILFVIIAGTVVLYFGRAVLIPLAFALVLAMLMLPLSRRLERWGVNKAVAAVLSILAILTVFGIIFSLLSWQLSGMMEDSGGIKEKVNKIITDAQNFLSSKFGLRKSEQKKMIEEGNSGMMSSVGGGLAGLFGVLVDTLLVLVYMFLFLFFRSHLLTALLKAVPDDQREKVTKIAREAGGVAQQYLLGLALMIVCLWVLYGIGFSIAGVKNALFFAILCGTLEMVPFVGNVTGTTLTALYAIVQGGGGIDLLWPILLTYGLVQFFQSYVLEPLIVGRQVNLNPLFTILCIVLGEAVWGIAGMVLAVPIFGMLKIACDHFEPLKPYGYLLGEPPKKNDGSKRGIKKWFGK